MALPKDGSSPPHRAASTLPAASGQVGTKPHVGQFAVRPAPRGMAGGPDLSDLIAESDATRIGGPSFTAGSLGRDESEGSDLDVDIDDLPSPEFVIPPLPSEQAAAGQAEPLLPGSTEFVGAGDGVDELEFVEVDESFEENVGAAVEESGGSIFATSAASDDRPAAVGVAPAFSIAIADALAAARGSNEASRIATLERELPALVSENDPARSAVMEYEIGWLLESSAGDPQSALEAYARAAVGDASLVPALWSLRRLLEARGLHSHLLELIDQELQSTRPPRQRAELLVERGQILEERLEREEEALQSYRTALVEDASSLAALVALEGALSRKGDVEGLAEIYRRLADLSRDPARKVELLVDLARLSAAQPDSIPVAVYAILLEAYEVGAANERVLDEMERYAEAGGHDDVWLATQDLRVARCDEEARFAGAGPTGDRSAGDQQARKEQARWIDEAAARRCAQAKQIRLTDAAAARGYLEDARARAPNHPVALADLTTLARDEGRYEEVATLLAIRAENSSGMASVRLQLERATALRQAGQPAQADEVEARLAADPELGPALPLALVIARQEALPTASESRPASEHFAELAGLRAEEANLLAALGDPRAAAEAWTAVGALYERGGKTDEAIASHHKALALLPSSAAALEALDVLLARAARHGERAKLLDSRLAAADVAGMARLLEELTDLRDRDLGDAEGALAAVEALFTLRGRLGSDDIISRARFVEIARRAGRWDEAAEHLEFLAESLDKVGATARSLEARVERADLLARHLGQRPLAIEILERILAQTPGHREARRLQRRLLSALDPEPRWSEVARSLREEITFTGDDTHVARLLVELAQLEATVLHRPEQARQTYRKLLERVALGRYTVSVAERLQGPQGTPEGQRDLARRLEASLADTGPAGPSLDARAEGWLRLGELYEDDLSDPALAADAYSRSLAVGGTTAPHAALGLYRAMWRSGDAAGALQGLAVLIERSSGKARAALVEERAWWERQEPEAAEKLLDEAQALDPASWPILLARWEAAPRSGPSALLSVLSKLAPLVPASHGALRGAWTARSGLIARALRGTPSVAAMSEALAAAAPADRDLILTLIGELSDEPQALARRAQLVPEARRTGLEAEAVEALLARGRIPEAAAAIEAALAGAPDDLVLLELARRISELGDDEAGEARTRARLGALSANAEHGISLLREAATRLELLGESEAAASAWRVLLEKRPADEEAFERARALLETLADPGGLDELLGDRLAVLAEQGSTRTCDRAALLVERGNLRRERRLRAAESDYREALALVESDTDALRALGTLLAETNRAKEAIEMFSRLEEHARDPEAGRFARQALSELHDDAGDRKSAAEVLERLVDDAPADRAALVKLAALEESLGRFEGLASSLRRLAPQLGDPRERARTEVRLARVLAEKLDDRPAARVALHRSLEDDPIDLEALEFARTLADTEPERDAWRGSVERAIERARSILDADPTASGCLGVLSRCFVWLGDVDAAALAAQAALARGKAGAARERASLPAPDRLRPAALLTRLPVHELPADLYTQCFSSEARGFGLSMWREAEAAVARFFGADLTSLGVGRIDLLNETRVPPAWTSVDRIAHALGIREYELYQGPQPEQCNVTEDAVVVGAAFRDPLTPERRFRLARKIALLRDGTGPLDGATDAEVELFFYSCARFVESPWKPQTLPSEALVEARGKILGKLLERKTRKSMTALAPGFATFVDVARWRREMLAGVAKLALVIGGDLTVALTELGLDAAQGEGATLARFAVSEAMSKMRRSLGLKD